MNKLSHTSTWQALLQHHERVANEPMQHYFSADPERFNRFSLHHGNILFDYSKNRITEETRKLLCQLAVDAGLADKIDALFSGKNINSTESRPALHTALRHLHRKEFLVNQQNIMPEIHETLSRMQKLTESIRQQKMRGITGKPIRDIVNIGIGGSHLGPLMTTHALRDFSSPALRCFFISNLDGAELAKVLKQIDPERTLFIVSSKSFTTLETLTNANTIKSWLQTTLGQQNVLPHFAAVTAQPSKAKLWGIDESAIFPFWEWVGGRYSIWSAIGLPLAIMIGMDNFHQFLSGAHDVDQHFSQTEFQQNIPVIMGLLGIWYINFFGCAQHVLAAYSHDLDYFRSYIQQVDMESNGKQITQNGAVTDYLTGPVIFGEQGCDSQHSFFQLLHQGPRFIPVDFILVANNAHFPDHQDALVASGLSQAKALMQGKSIDAILQEASSPQLAPHKSLPGNRPSNTFLLDKMTPHNLGALIAFYEHKIFVQGAIWDINSFDQWGVELGKQLLPAILNDLRETSATLHDSSTMGLIQHYKTHKAKE